MNRYFFVKLFLGVIFIALYQNCSSKKELKVHDSNGVLLYEWFFEKDTLTGKKITYWANGKVKEVHNFENGKLNGEYLGYYANGHIARRSFFYNNIIRGAALKFFEQVDSVVETEQYFLDVGGKQYGYYYKVFNESGRLVSEDRTVGLDFDCVGRRKSARIYFSDDFQYDSVYLIIGNFADDFSLDEAVSIDTLRITQLPITISLDSLHNRDNVVRGKCIFFAGTSEVDSSLVNVKMRWFEERVPAICDSLVQ
ncbi:MAG TPA: hypothetical protein VK658_09105 [Chryseolinea sp.]|nr:hypothetical protein [Chryseolinea sp.]